jgi:copper chaperone NosL
MNAPYLLIGVLVLLSCCIDSAGETMGCCDESGGGDAGYVCEECGMPIAYEMMKFSSFVILKNNSKADFCSICCMLDYFDRVENQSVTPKAYVADYGALDWVAAQEAFYVRGGDIITPMDCGVVAFGSHETALRFKEEHGGEIMSFQEMVSN